MEIQRFFALLARRWILVVTVMVLAFGVSIGATVLIPPTYRADTQLFVSTQIDSGNLNQALYQGGSFSAERVKSYTELATSPKVLELTNAQLQLQLGPGELADKVTASVPVDTVLIRVSVTDRSPDVAAALANSVASSLAQVIEELETPTSTNLSPVNAAVVSEAVPPGSPVWPDLGIMLSLGLLAGLVIGIGLVVLLDNLDTTVNNADDLAKVTEVPLLAAVVREGGGGPDGAIVHGDGSARTEAYRQLRTNLQFAAVSERPGIIVVTSAVSGEGKSSTAGNLAVAASQLGLSVCLIDGDLRRPCIAKYFGLVGEVGLTTVLIGRVTLEAALQPVAPGLTAITSGSIPPNPTELLGSEQAGVLFRTLSEQYDMVVIDAPPVLPVADAAVLAAGADGVLFVIHTAKTTHHQVAHSLTALGQVKSPVLGAVLNMVPPRSRRGFYGYGYGYTYKPYQPSKPPVVESEDDVSATPTPAASPTPVAVNGHSVRHRAGSTTAASLPGADGKDGS